MESTSIHVLLFKDCSSLFSLPVTSLGTCFVSECRSVSDLHSLYVHTKDVDTLIHARAHANMCMHTHKLEDEAVSGSGNVVKNDAE